MSHNVRANDGSFSSVTAPSFTYSFTFNEPGSFSYRCTIHPAVMTGVITVEGAAPTQAELSLKEVSVALGNYPQGSSISIDAEVDNLGNAASGAFTISHYASSNNSITAQDTLLGTENRASLPAGEDSSGPFNAMIPIDLPPGSYFIGSIINYNDANAGNNDNIEEGTITVTAAAGSFQINAGLNDAWYNPATDGQGFFINVFPLIQKVFVGWFTYDVDPASGDATAVIGGPGQRWITAFGDYSGDTASLDIDIATGGAFDSGQPMPVHQPDGSLIIQFTDCTHAEVMYDIVSADVSGIIPIQRVTNDNAALCETLQAQ
jgi:hypothetical protein